MRCKSLIVIGLILASAGVLAAGESYAASGDPGKGSQGKPTFTLVPGYFSFFTLFTDQPHRHAAPDTIRVISVAPRMRDELPREDVRRPK